MFPTINPYGRFLDKIQEYSAQWILAADTGTTACVRGCGFGLSRDICRNAGITQSPSALHAQPHTVSGFLQTTLKCSSSTKCGLSDGTSAVFCTSWSPRTLQPSISWKRCLLNIFFFPRTCWSQSKLDHKWLQSAKAMKREIIKTAVTANDLRQKLHTAVMVVLI